MRKEHFIPWIWVFSLLLNLAVLVALWLRFD